MFLARIVLYWDVHSAIKDVDPDHKDKGIGSYMAEYVDNTTASIVVTIVILTLLSFFYVSNFYIIKLMTKMLDFILSQQEDNLISQSILRNNQGLYTNQSQADPNNFFVG